jgi:hypothetical protein
MSRILIIWLAGALSGSLTDEATLRKAGVDHGARGLGPLITAGPRDERVTAILAAPYAEDAWALLDPLTADMAAPDRPIAAAAARAAARIAEDLPEDADIPDDELALAAGRCAALARRVDVWPDVRVEALHCANALGATDALVDVLGASGESEVRRAAAELLSPREHEAALRKAVDDPDDAVAATAAAVLCREDFAVGQRARALLRKAPIEPALMAPLRRCQ